MMTSILLINMMSLVMYCSVNRDTFDRLFASTLPSKKMQTFYKRLVQFELRYGNDEGVLRAKRKALEFVERQKALLG